MKNVLLIVCIVILTISCNQNKPVINLTGSYYYLNKDSAIYREIHINDSLLLYSYDDQLAMSYYYTIEDDSVFLMLEKNSPLSKYQIVKGGTSEDKLFLINENDSLFFSRMNFTIKNIDDYFTDIETLEIFIRDCWQRKYSMLYGSDNKEKNTE